MDVHPDLMPEYSNAMNMTFNKDEFTLIFVHVIPQMGKAKAKAIIATNPAQLKRIYDLLGNNIELYESKYGEIKLEESNDTRPDNSTLYG